MGGKNKKKGGNKQAASEQAPRLPGLSFTYSSAKSGTKKVKVAQSSKESAEAAAVVKDTTNAKSEVPTTAPTDSRSKRQQKRDKANDVNGETRVVQEEQLKLQDQGILQIDDEVEFEKDSPPNSHQKDHRLESYKGPQAPQHDLPPTVENWDDIPSGISNNPPNLTTDSHQDDYSKETGSKDIHNLDCCEEPQAMAREQDEPPVTERCDSDHFPNSKSAQRDSLKHQEMQQVSANPYQIGKSMPTAKLGLLNVWDVRSETSATTSNQHFEEKRRYDHNRNSSNREKGPGDQNPYRSSESSCATNNRNQQQGRNTDGSAGTWASKISPHEYTSGSRKSYTQGPGNSNLSFENKSSARGMDSFNSRNSHGKNEKWKGDHFTDSNMRNQDNERRESQNRNSGSQSYYNRDFTNSNRDGRNRGYQGKSNNREGYKSTDSNRRNQGHEQKGFDGNKGRRNRSREDNPDPSGNKSCETSRSKEHEDQPDVSWEGGEGAAGVWESEGGGPDGSWDHHLQNERSREDGYKGKRNRSRESRSDEPDNQSWGDEGNRDPRRNRSREGKSNRNNWSGNENYRGQGDGEFEEFWKFYRSHKKESFKKVKEIEEDLFNMPPEYALAHCVAEDMSMGSGIAVQFSQQFKSRDELYQQRQKQGGLAFLTIKGRYIYYLVTKRLSNGKPTMHTMWSSLRKLQQHMEENKVDKLAIPRIGCGLDRLEWSEVKAMIEYVFRNVNVEVTVCNFQQNVQQSSASTQKGSRKCPVRNVAKPLVQIEGGTAVIYFGTEDGFVSEAIESLDTKFRIINDYKTAKRSVGEVVLNYKNNYGYALYGFIINKRKEDPFDFVNLQKCLGHLKKQNRQDKYGYVAFEAFLDEDDLIVSKICGVLRYSLYDVEVYVCWPSKMVSFMPRERQDDYY